MKKTVFRNKRFRCPRKTIRSNNLLAEDTIMSKTRHTIRRICDNLLTRPNDFTAASAPNEASPWPTSSARPHPRRSPHVSGAAMSHAVELSSKEMAYRLCDGFAVNTGYFTAILTSYAAAISEPGKNIRSAASRTLQFQFTPRAN